MRDEGYETNWVEYDHSECCDLANSGELEVDLNLELGDLYNDREVRPHLAKAQRQKDWENS